MEFAWISGLFLLATLAALITGQAYYRGMIHRDEDPRQYWSAVGGYVLLSLLAPGIELLRGMGVGR